MLYTAQPNLHSESKKEVRAAMIELAKSADRLGPVMRDNHFFENHGVRETTWTLSAPEIYWPAG